MEYTTLVQNKHWKLLSKNLLDRLQNEKHTDCIFIIGKHKTEFKVSRFILSLVSPVFEAMLYGNMRESENNSTVIIDDVDVEAFKCVISFSYGNDPQIDLNNVSSLLMICDKYQILELLKITKEFFAKSLNAKNFCVLFNKSITSKSEYCINVCIEFIKQAYLQFDINSHSEIMKSSFILNANTMKTLLGSDYLLVSEEVIWESYIQWQRYQLQTNNTQSQSLELDENEHKINDKHKLYKLIRFGLMDSKYFVKCVIPKQILSDSELVKIMKYNICQDEGCGGFKTNQRGKDCWSSCIGDNLEIHDDNCLIHRGTDRLSQTALLTMEFDTGIHKWSFRIRNLKSDIDDGSDWTSCFGVYKINSSKIPPVNNHFIWDQTNTGYAFCAHSAKLKDFDDINDYCISHDYGKECKSGDIIEMIVDMNKLELKYIINGVDYGKAFDIQRTKYRAAVNLDIPNDAIQLL